MTEYVYVYYDFGERLPDQQIKDIKIYLKQTLVGKECFGSINAYCGRINGFLVMEKGLFEMFRADASSIFDGALFSIKEHSDATFCIHDKWGRAESFLLFD